MFVWLITIPETHFSDRITSLHHHQYVNNCAYHVTGNTYIILFGLIFPNFTKRPPLAMPYIMLIHQTIIMRITNLNIISKKAFVVFSNSIRICKDYMLCIRCGNREDYLLCIRWGNCKDYLHHIG